MGDNVRPIAPKQAARRYVNFRRAMALQEFPIMSFGRDMFRIAPHGQRAHWVAVIQVPTRNISTCADSEQDRILYHMIKFLNDQNDSFQWRFTSRPVDPSKIITEIDSRLAALPDHDERRVWLEDLKDHLTALVRLNGIPQAGLYLVVRVPSDGPTDDKDAVARKLESLCKLAISNLHPAGLEARRLNSDELLALLWADLNPDLLVVHNPPTEYQSVVTMARPPVALRATGNYMSADDPISSHGQTYVDVIAPQDLAFHKDRLEINSAWRSVLVARTWPSYLQFNALRHLTNSHLQVDISIHATPVDTGEALRYLDDRIRTLTMAAEKDQYEGYTADYRIQKYQEQARYCREQLEQGHQRWFFTALYVAVTASTSQRLDEDIRTVQSLLNKADVKLVPAFRQQREGLLATLPLVHDPIDASRNMLSDGLANLSPLDSQQLMHPAGMYGGLSRLNNSLIMFNVWALKNYNITILGVPGAGKTMCERAMIQHYHTMTDDAQMIADPDGEMDAYVLQLGGTVIRLGGSSKHRINIMDLALDWDNDAGYRRGRPLDKQIPMLTDWLEYQIGTPGPDGRRHFDPVQRSRVMFAISHAYERYGITHENQGDLIIADGQLRTSQMPVLDDLREELAQVDPPLAEAMGIFTFGAMALFNARTNVEINNRLISLNLRDLDPATRGMALPWLVNWMWARVGLNRYHKRNTHLYFEEILAFLEEPIAAEYISMIWTRGRKWRCSPVAVSQLLERLMATPVGRTIVKTSDLKVLFDQGDALPEIQQHCQLSDAEASYVRGSQPGQGLYVVGPFRMPFMLVLSAYQYEFFTTKPGEMKEVD